MIYRAELPAAGKIESVLDVLAAGLAGASVLAAVPLFSVMVLAAAPSLPSEDLSSSFFVPLVARFCLPRLSVT